MEINCDAHDNSEKQATIEDYERNMFRSQLAPACSAVIQW
jgi:hypothetical protein